MDEDSGEEFFYNDISGALTFDEPDEASGGGLDVPVMPSMSDVLEARRWDLHNAILLHGGYREVTQVLGWMTKRNTENRHLLRFSTLAHEIGEFLEEYGDYFCLAEGRMPSCSQLQEADRDDLVQGVKWHGGVTRVARRMGKLPYGASALTRLPAAAASFAEFAALETAAARHPLPKGQGFMPTDSNLRAAGRNDLRWAIHLHSRARLAEAAGLADPNAPDLNGSAVSQRLRLDHREVGIPLSQTSNLIPPK